jgi:succinate dehydrogenase / fumarate reductase, flavoprotein subunit
LACFSACSMSSSTTVPRNRARKTRASVNREYNPGWHTCMDLTNLMTVSEAVTRAALERKESRGGQFRDDYPKKDNKNFGQVNTVVWKGADGRMQFRWEKIPVMPAELKEIIKEQGDGKLPEELA